MHHIMKSMLRNDSFRNVLHQKDWKCVSLSTRFERMLFVCGQHFRAAIDLWLAIQPFHCDYFVNAMLQQRMVFSLQSETKFSALHSMKKCSATASNVEMIKFSMIMMRCGGRDRENLMAKKESMPEKKCWFDFLPSQNEASFASRPSEQGICKSRNGPKKRVTLAQVYFI